MPSGTPFRLCTLGCVALEQDGAPVDSVGGQRKMLALLAVLAVAGRRGISREKLEGLLWPESDHARARGALKQALHTLRKELGTGTAVLGVGELRLNDSVVESDVQSFLNSIDSRDRETAVSLYRGPFLDGFFLSDAPEFERWVETWRGELSARHASAVEELAVEAGARGEHAAAVRWWRKLNAVDPFSGRVTIQLMRALEAIGERAAAIRCAAAHEAIMREEMGSSADPEISELARVLLRREAPSTSEDPAGPNDGVSLLPRGTSIPEAYDLYLHARQRWKLRTPDSLPEAVRHYEAAVELDPEFARAWAGLAEAYINLSNLGRMSVVEALALAERAADHAISLDGRLAEAHAAKGFVLTSRLEFEAAEAAFVEALQVNGNYTWGHHYYSLLLLMLGRTDEALQRNDEALRTDPLSRPANATRGVVLCQGGDYRGAAAELERALILASEFTVCLAYLGVVRAALGDAEAALLLIEKAARKAPDFPNVPSALAYLYSDLGRRDEAESLLATLDGRGDEPRARANLALALGSLRRLDAAFELAEMASWDVPSLIALRTDPLLHHLRGDSRYPRLLSRLGACSLEGS